MEVGGPSVALHVRGPHTDGAVVYQTCAGLVDIARTTGALLTVNDRIDVAIGLLRTPEMAPVGGHLGQRSLPLEAARGLVGPQMLLGCSAHDGEEVAEAVAGGADYLFFGHVYPTPSHADQHAVGPGGLEAAVQAAGSVPVMAIGGLEPRRVAEVVGAGAHGIATLRGIWDAPAPKRATRDYISALADSLGGRDEMMQAGGSHDHQ